jgi:hypothetical protein
MAKTPTQTQPPGDASISDRVAELEHIVARQARHIAALMRDTGTAVPPDDDAAHDATADHPQHDAVVAASEAHPG